MQRTFFKDKKVNTELRLLSSSSAQLLVDFPLLPTISQARMRYRSSCFLYLSRSAPVHTQLNGHFRFSNYLIVANQSAIAAACSSLTSPAGMPVPLPFVTKVIISSLEYLLPTPFSDGPTTPWY